MLLAVLVGLLGVCSNGIATAHLVAALAAYGLDVDFLVGIAVDELVGDLENVRIECAGETLVAADNDHQNSLFRPGNEEGVTDVARSVVVKVDAAAQRIENARNHARIRPRGERPLL